MRYLLLPLKGFEALVHFQFPFLLISRQRRIQVQLSTYPGFRWCGQAIRFQSKHPVGLISLNIVSQINDQTTHQKNGFSISLWVLKWTNLSLFFTTSAHQAKAFHGFAVAGQIPLNYLHFCCFLNKFSNYGSKFLTVAFYFRIWFEKLTPIATSIKSLRMWNKTSEFDKNVFHRFRPKFHRKENIFEDLLAIGSVWSERKLEQFYFCLFETSNLNLGQFFYAMVITVEQILV